MRYQIRGADRKTGQDIESIVDAPDDEMARLLASEHRLLYQPFPMSNRF